MAFHVFQYVRFEEKDLYFAPFCLSRLVASSLFLQSKNLLLGPKTPLFNDHFALFSPVFHGS